MTFPGSSHSGGSPRGDQRLSGLRHHLTGAVGRMPGSAQQAIRPFPGVFGVFGLSTWENMSQRKDSMCLGPIHEKAAKYSWDQMALAHQSPIK